MAYSITATPATYSSVHDDLIYTVNYPEHASDPATYPNFKYIGDVYIGATLVARLRKIQDPVTGIGIFNIGQIVRNYLATVFNPTANIIVSQTLGDGFFSVNVTMKFGEEYSFGDHLNSITDSARLFYNNYNGRLLGAATSLAAFTNKVASNRPLISQTLLTSPYNFMPYFPIVGTAVNFIVTPFGGGSVYSTTFTPTTNVLQSLNISPVAINAVAPGTITANTNYYTVQIGSQTFTIQIICEAVYSVSMIHFLNQYGGFESKLFSKVSRRTYEITRKDFGKLPYTVDGSGNVLFKNSNGVYNESRSAYANTYKEKLALNSDLLTDTEYTWLRDLILSPMVYVEDGGYFFPCVITDNNYEPKKNVNDDLSNLTINIEFGNQLNAQFR